MIILIKLLFVIAVCFVVYIYLIAPRIFNKPDYSSLMGFHYAHRGLFNNSSNAPENSLNAFKCAVEHGYGIEFDVQLSKDGIPVVFHDASLKRMCNTDGNVWEFTLKELKELRLGGSNQTIPTLTEVLDCINGKVPVIIEYKLDIASTDVCRKANKLLKNYKGIYCIESFHPFALIWYRFKRPDIVRGQLSMEYLKDEVFKGKPLYTLLSLLFTNVMTRPDFIAYKHSDASNLSFRICRKLGAMSFAWTIRSKKEYENVADKFDMFIFDSFLL